MLHAAQVAEAFLADAGDEENVAVSFDLGGLERAHEAEDDRQTARIVADARPAQDITVALHLHVGSLGKDRIQM